jgi:hypothetical protein
MGSLLNAGDRQVLFGRVASLSEASTPLWGRMTVVEMLSHLCQSAEMALGELAVRSHHKRAFEFFPLKHLILYVLPFPKGASTPPELLSGERRPVTVAQAVLQQLLGRIGEGPVVGMGPVHPLLGRLSRREWGTLMYKHVDHHLRQFGV